jgi:hypothetical protein
MGREGDKREERGWTTEKRKSKPISGNIPR